MNPRDRWICDEYTRGLAPKAIGSVCDPPISARRVREILELNGLYTRNPKHHLRKHTRESLTAHLRALTAGIDRPPTVKELIAAGPPYPASYQTEFGSLRLAVIAAGLEPNDPGGVSHLPSGNEREAIILHLKTLAAELGRTPESTDIERATHRSIITEFGPLDLALRAAGITP